MNVVSSNQNSKYLHFVFICMKSGDAIGANEKSSIFGAGSYSFSGTGPFGANNGDDSIKFPSVNR